MIHNPSKWIDQRLSVVSKLRMLQALGFLLSLLLIAGPVYAQVTTSITPTTGAGNLSTSVTQAGNVYNITGGTRPGNGTNLFHSFGNFSVGAFDTARFLNTTPEPTTSNILGRVTGGNISNIFGTIQTQGYGNANLFLMNPAGFLFGPNATVNVGGMVAFTSADYLRLEELGGSNAGIFHADPAQASVLTSAPVAAFGFLGSNPGTITFQGSQFTVTEGAGISLVGGNITIQSGTLEDATAQPSRLSAPAGQINLASAASPGDIPTSNYVPSANMTLGSITLSEGSVLDISANAAGTVRIRSGALVMDNATISADTVNANGAPVAVDINLTGNLTISDTRGIPAITARTSGTGNAGEVQISSANMQITSNGPDAISFALIDTHSSGDGRAGNVAITTGNLSVIGSNGAWHFIDSGPQADGPGGNITIEAQHSIELTGTTISTGTQLAETLGLEPSGPAGNLTLTADRLVTENTFLLTTATFGAETQQAGNITMNVRDISMANSGASAAGFFGGGAITINADRLITDATQFDTFTAFGPAEGITFNGRILELRNGSTWSTSTFGDVNAGNILVTATDHVSLLGATESNSVGASNPSGLFSNSFGDLGSLGGSGNIAVTTQKLTMTAGRINTSTATSGRGGDVIVNANAVEMSGEFPYPVTGGFFGITNIHPSGIFTQTVGSEFCAGPCGDAGNIVANVGKLTMGPGAQLNSGTTNTGRGGDITINATDSISMSGTLSNGSPVGILSQTTGTNSGSGYGGFISVTGQSVSLSNGAVISADTTGTGTGGSITIGADSTFASNASTVSSTATQAAGGDITITSGESVTLNNGSLITASSSGLGNAGSILINAGQNYTSTDSAVTTKAAQASGGDITVLATDIVQLTNSQLNASVQGSSTTVGGNITIDPLYIILLNSQILAQATQGQGGAISFTITNGGLYLPDATSTVSASSQFGVNGIVTIQSPNAPASGKIIPLSQKPLLATSLLNQRCAALAGGEFSSFTVAGRDSLPIEPGSWLASPLAFSLGGTGGGTLTEKGGRASLDEDPAREMTILSLRQISPAGFLTQSFAVEGSAGCQS